MKTEGGVKYPGVLTEKHDRLLADLDRIVERAGLGVPNKHLVWESTKEHLTKLEVRYLTHVRELAQHNIFGAVLHGTPRHGNPHARMQRMVGCLLRNYLDARIMPLDTVMAYLSDGQPLKATVLFIPDFFIAKHAENTPPWKLTLLTGLLFNRAQEGVQTVVYVDDMSKMRAIYGTALHATIRDFQAVEA